MVGGMLFIVAGAMFLVGLGLLFLSWTKIWQGAGPRQQAEQAGDDQQIAELVVEVIAERKGLHAKRAGILRALLGFQNDSTKNQLEHLESLLMWALTQACIQLAAEGQPLNKDQAYAMALQSIHTKLLAPVENWREKVFTRDQIARGAMRGADPSFVRLRSEHDHARVGLVTASGVASQWAMMQTGEQLVEILIYLLVWGEAGNLRFMPEMLAFLFEVARAKASKEFSIPPPDDAEVAHSYLERIVKPIYKHVAEENSNKNNPDKDYVNHRNYDDFNEAFWRIQSIQRLRTRLEPDSSGVTPRRPIMDFPPSERYDALQQADWAHFFAKDQGVPKTHRETIWWSSLLVANRRIFLCHAAVFAAIVLISQREAFPVNKRGTIVCTEIAYEQCAQPWRWWWAAPALALLAPASTFLGRWIECGYNPNTTTRAAARNATWLLGALAACALLVWWVQATLSLCEYECAIFADWLLPADGKGLELRTARRAQLTGVHVVSMLVLVVCGVLSFVKAMLPARAGGAMEAAPAFEAAVAALPRKDWIGRVALRKQRDGLYMPTYCALRRQGVAFESLSEQTAVPMNRNAARTAGAPPELPMGASFDAESGRLVENVLEETAKASEWCQALSCWALTLAPAAVLSIIFVLLSVLSPISYILNVAIAVSGAALVALAFLAAINTGRGPVESCSKISYALDPTLQQLLRMYAFWACVWLCKILFGLTPVGVGPSIITANELLGGGYFWPNASETARTTLPIDDGFTTESLLRALLMAAAWSLAFYIFIAETLGWYQLVLAVWGGVPHVVKATRAIVTDGRRWTAMVGDVRQDMHWAKSDHRDLLAEIEKKLVGAPANRKAEAAKYWEMICDELYEEHHISCDEHRDLKQGNGVKMLRSHEAVRRLRSLAVTLKNPNLMPSRAFRVPGMTTLVPSYNEAIIHKLPDREAEMKQIEVSNTLDSVFEAPFKLSFYLAAFSWALIGALLGVLLAMLFKTGGNFQKLLGGPGFLAVGGVAIVLSGFACYHRQFYSSDVKEQKEQIKAQLVEIGADPQRNAWKLSKHNIEDKELVQASQLRLRELLGSTPPKGSEDEKWLKLKDYGPPADRAKALSMKDAALLMGEFKNDWTNLLEFLRDNGRSGFDADDAVRKWASNRMQSVYRTIRGTVKNHRALSTQLQAELPDLPVNKRDILMRHKCRTVWALQTFSSFNGQELVDVNTLLDNWGQSGVAIAYIHAEGGKHYSCLLEASGGGTSNAAAAEPVKPKPKFKIELPGVPILSDGKPDNQNCALIFTRGHIIQAMDCNQEGYLEEAFKLSSALREFDGVSCTDPRGPPAILGFGEHVFSGIGALGNFAAASELAFGTQLQNTMANVLQCRMHYGHPDLFDKLAIITQGGMSKGVKKLNLSEDIFAGMEATLRQRTIKHISYFQVGKGRDMGLMSILGFFFKLSSGTAEMTTSRQALRLGQRLGFGRLCGFYYAHIGFYAGQLHYWHVAYGQVALAFLGVLVDASGILTSHQAVSPACMLLFNNLNGPVSLLFFAFSVLPLFFVTWERQGLLHALWRPLKQILQLSPLFFIVQGRLIGHSFSRELSLGKAGYIATGRGLAIEHIPLHKVYAFLGMPCFYAGLEYLVLIGGLALLSSLGVLEEHNVSLSTFSLFFACLMPTGLIMGPTLFNPRCFSPQCWWSDVNQFFVWLLRDHHGSASNSNPDRSWSEYHQKRVEDKSFRGETDKVCWGPRAKFIWLPSKELLISVPLTILSHHITFIKYSAKAGGEETTYSAWRLIEFADLVAPVVPFVLVGIAVLAITIASLCGSALETCCGRLLHKDTPSDMRIYLTIAASVLGLVVTEEVLKSSTFPALTVADRIVLFSCRFFSWRWSINVLAYLSQWPVDVAIESGKPMDSTQPLYLFNAFAWQQGVGHTWRSAPAQPPSGDDLTATLPKLRDALSHGQRSFTHKQLQTLLEGDAWPAGHKLPKECYIHVGNKFMFPDLFPWECLRMPRRWVQRSSAVTMTSVALLVDMLVGTLLIVLNLALVLVAEGLRLITCTYINLDEIWFQWIVKDRLWSYLTGRSEVVSEEFFSKDLELMRSLPGNRMTGADQVASAVPAAARAVGPAAPPDAAPPAIPVPVPAPTPTPVAAAKDRHGRLLGSTSCVHSSGGSSSIAGSNSTEPLLVATDQEVEEMSAWAQQEPSAAAT